MIEGTGHKGDNRVLTVEEAVDHYGATTEAYYIVSNEGPYNGRHCTICGKKLEMFLETGDFIIYVIADEHTGYFIPQHINYVVFCKSCASHFITDFSTVTQNKMIGPAIIHFGLPYTRCENL